MPDEKPSVGIMLGKGAEIRALGKTWKLSAPDQNAKDRLEKLVVKTVLDEVRKLKGVLDAAAYKEAFESVVGNLRNYHTWRPGWQAIVLDPGNAHLYLWSLLQESHPNLTEDELLAIATDAPEEVNLALAQVLPDFFRLLLDPLRKQIAPEVLASVEEKVGQLRERLAPTANSSK